jgi:hypothetical protein
MPGCATTAAGLHPTATYVAHLFQPNFELHPYDVEK